MTTNNERPYTTTFAVQVCVEADSQTEAEKKATQWGMRFLDESAAVPREEDGAPFKVEAPPCTAGRFSVPLVGTVNLMAQSQAEVDARTQETLEQARTGTTAIGITMGGYRIFPGPLNRHTP